MLLRCRRLEFRIRIVAFQIAYVESLARIASQIGAKIVRIFTAYEVEAQDPQVQWKRCVTAIREMCDRVVTHGLSMAIQNHHASLCTPQRCSRCWATSTGPIARWGLMRGHRHCVVRICMNRRNRQRRTRSSLPTRTTSRCRAIAALAAKENLAPRAVDPVKVQRLLLEAGDTLTIDPIKARHGTEAWRELQMEVLKSGVEVR